MLILIICLVPSIEWLISLTNGDVLLLKMVAKSLESICEKGYKYLSNYFEPLTQIILNIENVAHHNGQVIESALNYLLKGLKFKKKL